MFIIGRKYGMKLNPLKCTFGVKAGKILGFVIHQRGIETNPEKIKKLLDMESPNRSNEVQSLVGRVAMLNRFVSKSNDKCASFFNVLKWRKKFEWTQECEQAFETLKIHLSETPILSKPFKWE